MALSQFSCNLRCLISKSINCLWDRICQTFWRSFPTQFLKFLCWVMKSIILCTYQKLLLLPWWAIGRCSKQNVRLKVGGEGSHLGKNWNFFESDFLTGAYLIHTANIKSVFYPFRQVPNQFVNSIEMDSSLNIRKEKITDYVNVYLRR